MSPKNAAKGETIVQPAHHLTGSGRFSVFVSYRTVDSAYTALLLQRDLTLRARSGRVFIDTGCIEFGDSIWQRIEPALNECDLVVVLIGPNWDEVVDDNKRRILEENDPIRNELRIAFRRQAGNEKIIVIPCLVNEGKIPSADVLPSDIKKLAGIRAIRLARDTWDKDLDSLAETHPALLRTSTQLQRSWRFWANVVVTPAVIIACLHFLHGQLLPNTGKVFWLFLVTAPTVLLALYHSLWEHIPRATVWLTALAIGFISNILMALSNIPSWSAEHLTQQASAFLIGVTLISLTYLVSTLVIRAIRPRA